MHPCLPPCSWKADFDAHSVPCDLKKFGDYLRDHYIPNSAIIDCTASDVPASNYLSWMQQGINVITPNKKLGSGPLEQYQVGGGGEGRWGRDTAGGEELLLRCIVG